MRMVIGDWLMSEGGSAAVDTGKWIEKNDYENPI